MKMKVIEKLMEYRNYSKLMEYQIWILENTINSMILYNVRHL